MTNPGPAVQSKLRPRGHDRPPLSFLSTTFQILMYLSVGFAILAVVVTFLAEDPEGFFVAAAMLGGALICGIGWVVVYIARTLDDIGFSVGAPAQQLPLPPARTAP